MHVSIQVEPVPYNTGHYTVDITYYYRVRGETSSTGKAGDGVRAASGCGRLAEDAVVVRDVHGIVSGVVGDGLDLHAHVHQLDIARPRACRAVERALGIER